MIRRPSIVALPLAMVSLFYANEAPAFKSTFKLPCMIFYTGKSPIATNCLADISDSQGVIVETVKTQNGHEFLIEKDNSSTQRWYLNRQPAMISDEPNTCYQNQEVKLCL